MRTRPASEATVRARRLARVAVAGAGALLLAACGGIGGATSQPTVPVATPASSPASAPSGATSSPSVAAGRPGIVAATTAGALVLLDPTTGSVTRTLVPSGVTGDEVSVSPDGSVAYYASGSGCDSQIESVSLSGGAPSVIGSGELPAVSPDGAKLAYAQEPLLTGDCVPSVPNLAKLYKLVIRTLSSGAQRILTLPPGQVSSQLPSPISHLSWASDSTRLAVSTSAIQDNEGWSLNIVDTAVARYYLAPSAGATAVPVTGSPDRQRSYIREGVFLPDGNLFISRACCGGVPIHNTSRLMWEVDPGGALVHQVAIGYPNLEHVSLAASPDGQWLLYLAGRDLYVSEHGNRPVRLTTGLVAATWA